jgi:hypothetical protein
VTFSNDYTYIAIGMIKPLCYVFIILHLLVHVLCKYYAVAMKQVRKIPQRLAFLPVSKARTNKLYVCMYIVYIYITSTNASYLLTYGLQSNCNSIIFNNV